MRNKVLGVIAGVLMMVPLSTSALTLSPQAQQQLNGLVAQLLQIMNQLSVAQSRGPAYAASAEFQQLASGITTQLAQIQTQLVPILVNASANPYTQPQANSPYVTVPTNACPQFSRDLMPGDQGIDVQLLQKFFSQESTAAFRGTINGYFDTETMLAVQRFQATRGIVAYGSWDTTGFGRVGPYTRTAIMSACAQFYNINQQLPPPVVQQPVPIANGPSSPSTGSFVAKYGGNSEANAVFFAVTAQPNPTCSSSQFTLTFGDNTNNVVVFPASCSEQTQNIRHVYGQSGMYSVTLASGNFQIGQSLSVPLSSSGGANFAMSATKGAVSYSAVISATSTSGSTCSASSYTISFGDGEKTTVDYPATCGVRVRTINHTYPEAGQYTISVSDSATTITSLVFTATVVAAAGAGDPYIATYLHADGADGSTTIVDSAPTPHTWTAYGNAAIDSAVAADGTGSLYFDGSGDYISTGASNDFNLGTNPFTIDLWFAANTFPGVGTQAALIQQANVSGQDNSFGGAGLELFGDKLYFVGTIGGTTYHPYYNNAPHTASLTASRWYHAAAVRNGNTVTLYLDGKKQGQITVAGGANASSNALTIGRFGEMNGNYYNGWIDELRISKGTARWTGEFTPPAVTGGTIPKGQTLSIPFVSSTSWLTTRNPGSGWQNIAYNDSSWTQATDEGGYGIYPWTGTWLATIPSNSSGRWIWDRVSNSDPSNSASETLYFRQMFISNQSNATLRISADNSFVVYLDGTQVATGAGSGAPISLSFTPNVAHVLAIQVTNTAGPGGLFVDVASGSALGSADATRKYYLDAITNALNAYHAQYGMFPSTDGQWFSSESGDKYSSNGGNYIPGLAPAFIDPLPRDPVGGISTAASCGSANREAFLYLSNGYGFKLLSTCSSTATWSSSDPYYDPIRPTWSWAKCSDSVACSW